VFLIVVDPDTLDPGVGLKLVDEPPDPGVGTSDVTDVELPPRPAGVGGRDGDGAFDPGVNGSDTDTEPWTGAGVGGLEGDEAGPLPCVPARLVVLPPGAPGVTPSLAGVTTVVVVGAPLPGVMGCLTMLVVLA